MRPNVSDEHADRVEEIAAAEATVPVEHLTFDQRLAVVLETHTEYKDRASAYSGAGSR